MGSETPQPETNPLIEDPRWQLVMRIVASPYFVRSDRLCSFLIYICEQSLQGRVADINEVNIGAQLFGRPSYDPSVDGLVRSHASRMRQRLEQYFSREGSEEPIRLLIPKGAYLPIFESRLSIGITPEVPPRNEASPEVAPIEPKDEAERKSVPRPLLMWILSAALALASITIVYLVVYQHGGTMEQAASMDQHPLWSMFFGHGRSTRVVISDASLAILQTVTEHDVTLPEYLSSDYRHDIKTPTSATTEVAKDLATRRYTGVVDVGILTKFYQLPSVHPDRVRILYSRDVTPSELKDSPVVLLGTHESNPWVEIYESNMNFVFHDDLTHRNFSVINRSPHGDELPQYAYDRLDPSRKVYGVAALRPSLGASGDVLILEGTSMAGTDAAAEFVFDDALLLPFLNKIRNADGSIPYFEVLLQSNNLNGDSSRLKIVAYRTSLS